MIEKSKVRVKDYESYYAGVCAGHDNAISLLKEVLVRLEGRQRRSESQYHESKRMSQSSDSSKSYPSPGFTNPREI